MTANDRFKQRFDAWLRASIIAAAVLHGCLFAFWPTMAASETSFDPDELEVIDIPESIPIPPPPEQIQRPSLPVVSETLIDQDVTIAETSFASQPLTTLPPPPTRSTANDDLSLAPRLTPMDVKPRVLNVDEVTRAMERNFPSMLRDAGVSGTAEVWLYLDYDGTVLKRQLNRSSGYTLMDEAALKVAEIMKFSPAKNRDKAVQVWVSQPITFSSH